MQEQGSGKSADCRTCSIVNSHLGVLMQNNFTFSCLAIRCRCRKTGPLFSTMFFFDAMSMISPIFEILSLNMI